MDIFETQNLIAGLQPEFTPDVTDKSILIIGMGGNGSHLALAAVRMGFRAILGVDCDVVSPSNLTRQILYTTKDIGRSKAEVAQESLEKNNLRSRIQIEHCNILNERNHFASLVEPADLVFIVVDQPGTTFFAVDTCFKLRKPAILGGTCVLSGTNARMAWMNGTTSPCLNCATLINDRRRKWAEYYSFDGRERLSKSVEVDTADELVSLAGGHPSFYPTACMGSNLMLAIALNLLMGRKNIPRQFDFSVLNLKIEPSDLKINNNCFTCSK
jgi:molybdopterin/thiamine biosynthesis adenylyltransferase